MAAYNGRSTVVPLFDWEHFLCQQQTELLREANLKQFKCVKPQKSEHTKRMMSQIKADSESKLQFNSLHSSRPPANNKTNSAPIKVNRAAILRQEAARSHQVEKEVQRVENLTAGTGEPSAFYQWQKDICAKDLQEELDKIERRFVQRCTENAKGAMARKHRTECNQKAAQLKKEETAELMRTYAEKKLKDKEELKALVKQVAECHINAKTAKEKLQRLNQRIVREVSMQNRELLRDALEAEEAELNKKFDIIQNIHAIESVPRIIFKKFDDTETAGDGRLGEMSLFELKERLLHLKEQEQREQQEKQEHILAQKQLERQQMQLKMEELEKYENDKRAQRQAAAFRKEEERKAKLRLLQVVLQSEPMFALQREAEKERQEYQRLRDEERQRMKDLLGKKTKTPQQKSVKMKTFEEIAQGIERYNQITYGHLNPKQVDDHC